MAKLYQDDILDTSVNTRRKYNMIQNADGTVSFEDATVYSQVGDTFGAADINAILGGQNIRYDYTTDMIQLLNADGEWVDWKRGGLTIVNLITKLGTDYNAKQAGVHTGTLSIVGNSLIVQGGGADGYDYVTFTSRDLIDFEGYNKLIVNCSNTNVVGGIEFGVVDSSGNYLVKTNIGTKGTYELATNDIDFGYIQFKAYIGNIYSYAFSEMILTN